MKKGSILFLVLLFCLSLSYAASAKMPYAPQRVIGLHVGPMNPTFDEDLFPDIDFYYTPNIKWSYGKAAGTPEVLTRWIEEKGLTMNELILIDKNGVVDFTGFLVPGKEIVEVQDLGHLRTLKEALVRIVEEGRDSLKRTEKPIKWDWVSDLEGRSFPDFEVVDSTGVATNTASVINAEGAPELIIVFRIPYNYKFQSVEEQMEEVEDPMALLGAISQMESGEQHTAYLTMIEKELFNR